MKLLFTEYDCKLGKRLSFFITFITSIFNWVLLLKKGSWWKQNPFFQVIPEIIAVSNTQKVYNLFETFI